MRHVWEHSVLLFPSRSDVWLFLALCSLSGAFGLVQLLVFLPVLYLYVCHSLCRCHSLFSDRERKTFSTAAARRRTHQGFNPTDKISQIPPTRENIEVGDKFVPNSLSLYILLCKRNLLKTSRGELKLQSSSINRPTSGDTLS